MEWPELYIYIKVNNIFLAFSKATPKDKEAVYDILDEVLTEEVKKLYGGISDTVFIDEPALFHFLRPFLPTITKIVEYYPDAVGKTLTNQEPILRKLISEFLMVTMEMEDDPNRMISEVPPNSVGREGRSMGERKRREDIFRAKKWSPGKRCCCCKTGGGKRRSSSKKKKQNHKSNRTWSGL